MKYRYISKKLSVVFGILFLLIILFISLSSPAFAQKMKRLSLPECMDIALSRNPAIKSAEENLIKARLQTRDAYSSILPKLSTGIDYAHFHSTPSPHDDNYSFYVDLQQPIYDQGKYSVLKKQAYSSIEISESDLDIARQEVLSKVINAYLDTLKASEMVNIARESRDRLGEHLSVAKRRLEVGLVAKNDVLRAEMELANAESRLIHAGTGLSLSNEQLQKTLHMEDEPFSVASIERIAADEKTIGEWIELAYQKRPDYLQMLKRKELASLGISFAKTDFFPFVSLFGNYSKSGERFFPDEEDITVGGRISIPIFEGGIRYTRLRKARHDLSLSEYGEADLKRQIRADVMKAYLNLEDLKATLKAIDKQIEYAQENMRIVEIRYQEGEATNLDVLDANLLLEQAKTDFATLNYDFIMAQFAILKSTGGLTAETIRNSLQLSY
ncbi:TolC family protein [bacterium]|nr:TolC family protein [bacterium]